LLTLALGACSVFSGSRPEPLPDFDSLWDYDRPGETEQIFRALLPAARASEDRSYHVQLLTQIARCQGLQMNFEEAHRTLDRAQDMLTPDMETARIRYLLERGRVHNSSGEPQEARPLFIEAWEYGLETGQDYYAVDAAHMMGIVEPPEKQLEWAERAMDLAERSTDERVSHWLGPLYNNTGWTYHDLGEYEKALNLFRKSLAWREERGDEEGARIARWTIARAQRSLGRAEKALEMQLAIMEEMEAAGLQEDGYVFEEIGECLLDLGRTDEARPYFRRAYELLSRDAWMAANEQERLARLKRLGSPESGDDR
jgi:tetratricopeptide (TPR) repeat protein